MSAAVGRRRSCSKRRFLLTGFGSKELKDLMAKIIALDAICLDQNAFHGSASHIVCKRPCRSEKFLGACATGKWILTPDYIRDSYQQRHWLEEEPFEWTPDKKSRVVGQEECLALLDVPRRCRLEMENKGLGPFHGWRAGVKVKCAKSQQVYRRLLEEGGAEVTHGPTTFNLTHLFVDPDIKDLAIFRDHGVLCLLPVYLGDYLTKCPKPLPDSYLLPTDYKPRVQPSSSQTSDRTRVSRRSTPTGSQNSDHAPSLRSQPSGSRTRGSKPSSSTGSQNSDHALSLRSQPSGSRARISRPSTPTGSQNSDHAPSLRSQPSGSRACISRPSTPTGSQNSDHAPNFRSQSAGSMNRGSRTSSPTGSLQSSEDQKQSMGTRKSRSKQQSAVSESLGKVIAEVISRGQAVPSTSLQIKQEIVETDRKIGTSSKVTDNLLLAKVRSGPATPSTPSKSAPRSSVPTTPLLTPKKEGTKERQTRGKRNTMAAKDIQRANVFMRNWLNSPSKKSPETSKNNSELTVKDGDGGTRVVPMQNIKVEKLDSLDQTGHCTVASSRKSTKARKSLAEDLKKEPEEPLVVGMSTSKSKKAHKSSAKYQQKSVKKESNFVPLFSPVKTRSKTGNAKPKVKSIEAPPIDKTVTVSLCSANLSPEDCELSLSQGSNHSSKSDCRGNKTTNAPMKSVVSKTLEQAVVLAVCSSDSESEFDLSSSQASFKSTVRSRGSKNTSTQKNNRKSFSTDVARGLTSGLQSAADQGQSHSHGMSNVPEESTASSSGHAVAEASCHDASRGLKRKVPEDLSPTENSHKVKKQNIIRQIPWLPVCHLRFWHPSFDEDTPKSLSLPMSITAVDVMKGCLEDHDSQPYRILGLLKSWVKVSQHPTADLLSSVYRQVLLGANTPKFAGETYLTLSRVVALHPPTNPALQRVYLHALIEPGQEFQQRSEFIFLQKVISGSLLTDGDCKQEQMNNFLLLKLLVSILQRDFTHHCTSRMSGTSSKPSPPLVAQIMWPLGYRTMDTSCREIIDDLLESLQMEPFPKKMELIQLLQSLVGMVAACLTMPTGSLTCPSLGDLSVPACLYAREIAYRINGDLEDRKCLQLALSSITVPWLLFKVSQTLLDLYDDSLLSINAGDVNDCPKSLKNLLEHYLYLVPPVSAEACSPHRKRDVKPTISDKSSARKKLELSSQASPCKSDILQVPSTEKRACGNGRKGTPSKGDSLTGAVLKRKMASINKKNCRGETPLQVACIKNNVSKVKELLQIPGIDVNMRDNAGWTALHEVCNHGHLDCLRELLKYRPPRKITSYFKPDVHDVKRLDLHVSNEEGITPLLDAVMNNHLEIARMLVQHGGSSLTAVKLKDGQTALDLAVSDEMKLILTEPGNQGLSNSLLDMSLSQELSCSQCSQGPDCSQLGSSVFARPSSDAYADILTRGQTVSSGDCLKYSMLVYQLIKSYVRFFHLLNRDAGDCDSYDFNIKPKVISDDLKTLKHLKNHVKGFKKHLAKLSDNCDSLQSSNYVLSLTILSESVVS